MAEAKQVVMVMARSVKPKPMSVASFIAVAGEEPSTGARAELV